MLRHKLIAVAATLACTVVAAAPAGAATHDAPETVEFADRTWLVKHSTAHARMNLWLFRGEAPTDGSRVRVVVSDFEFTPTD